MVNLKYAVLVTEAKWQIQPFDIALSWSVCSLLQAQLWGDEREGTGFKRLRGLAGVPDLRTDLTRRVQSLGIFK